MYGRSYLWYDQDCDSRGEKMSGGDEILNCHPRTLDEPVLSTECEAYDPGSQPACS